MVKAFTLDANTTTPLDTQLAAAGTAETDGEIAVDILMGFKDGGGFTPSVTSGGLQSVTRAAAASGESWWVSVPVPNRTTAGKGIMPTGMTVNYTVGTADVVVDLRCELWKVTQGADGAARTAAVLFGNDNADYDADHNTPAKRGDDTAAPELHKATLVDAGTPAYMGAGETLLFRFFVDDTGGGTSAVILTSAVVQFTENTVDLS